VPARKQTTSPAALLLKAFCKCCHGELKLPLFKSEPLGVTNFVQPDARPVPESAIVCGESRALSAMLTEAVRVPLAVGEKITVTAQLPPAAREEPQVLLCEKSPAFAPVTEMLVMLNEMLPLLLRVTV
jgi:hypothetical protein